MYEYFDAPSVSDFNAVPLDFALARLSQAEWSDHAGGALRARDLHLGAASKGQMGARHVEAVRAGSAEAWPAEGDPYFRFLYVVSGSASIEGPNETSLSLKPGDAVSLLDRTLLGRAEWDDEFGVVEITAPDPAAANGTDVVELLDSLRREAATRKDRTATSRETPESFSNENGLRSFMTYRDLGVNALTGRRIHIHGIRVTGTPPGGTGWHVHSMSQLFYVLRGWVDIAVEGQGEIRMQAGDAMCVANGMRHNVFEFSPDYELIEMCLPTDYSTVPTEPPAGARGEKAAANY